MNDTIKTIDNEDILAGSLSGTFDIAERIDAGIPKNTAMFSYACALCLYAYELVDDPFSYLFESTIYTLTSDSMTAYNCMHGAIEYIRALQMKLPISGLPFARQIEIITEYILLHSFDLYKLPEPAGSDEEEYQRQRNSFIIDDVLKYVQWAVEECLGSGNVVYISDERLLIALCCLNRITSENFHSARSYMYEGGKAVAYDYGYDSDLNCSLELVNWLRPGNNSSQVNFISDLLLIYYIAHSVRCFNEGIRADHLYPHGRNNVELDDLDCFINDNDDEEEDDDYSDSGECFDSDEEDDDSIFDEVFDFSDYD